GSTLLATSSSITLTNAAPSVTVSSTTVTPGSTINATVANGPGGRTDWLAIYSTSGGSYLTWMYLNGTQTAPEAGLTSATVAVTMPSTPGTYFIRLHTGASTVLATSATVTVGGTAS